MGPAKYLSNERECPPNVTDSRPLSRWPGNCLNLSSTEPYREIVKLIYDHPDARFSPQRDNQMPQSDKPVLVPEVKPEATASQINDSYLDNEHTSETPINKSNRQEEQGCEAESPKLAQCPRSSDDLHGSDTCDNKGTNQVCEDNIREENTALLNPLPRQCHANDDMDCDGRKENISAKTTPNNATVHQIQ